MLPRRLHTQVATRYRIIQFGIALFLRQGDGSLVAYPFNFYLFPVSTELVDMKQLFHKGRELSQEAGWSCREAPRQLPLLHAIFVAGVHPAFSMLVQGPGPGLFRRRQRVCVLVPSFRGSDTCLMPGRRTGCWRYCFGGIRDCIQL